MNGDYLPGDDRSDMIDIKPGCFPLTDMPKCKKPQLSIAAIGLHRVKGK